MRQKIVILAIATAAVLGVFSVTADALDAPIVVPHQWVAQCPSSAGPATSVLIPVGSTTPYAGAETIYVAPIVGAAVNVRLGGSDVDGTGFSIGPTGRDGPGMEIGGRQTYCISEGAAQNIDVIVGGRGK